jgi:hypothetical protein
MTPRFIPDLIDIQQELFELPQRVRRFSFQQGLRLTFATGTRHVQQGDTDRRHRI